MASSLYRLLLLGALAAAQTTTIDILLPVEAIHEVTGTAVAVGPELTTLAVHCGDDVNNEQCNILGTQTMTYGPSTLSIVYSHAGDKTVSYFSEDLNCAISGKSATCHVTIETTDDKGSTNTMSYTETDTNIETRMIPATITKGAEKLMEAAEATTPGSSDSPTTVDSSAAETAGTEILSSPTETPTPVDSGVQKASAPVLGVGLVAIAAALIMS